MSCVLATFNKDNDDDDDDDDDVRSNGTVSRLVLGGALGRSRSVKAQEGMQICRL